MNLKQTKRLHQLLIARGWTPSHPISVKTGRELKTISGCIYPLANGDHICTRNNYTFSATQKDFISLYTKNATIDFGDWHTLMIDDLETMAAHIDAEAKRQAKLLSWLIDELEGNQDVVKGVIDYWIDNNDYALDCHITTDDLAQDDIVAVFYGTAMRDDKRTTDTQVVVSTMRIRRSDLALAQGERCA